MHFNGELRDGDRRSEERIPVSKKLDVELEDGSKVVVELLDKSDSGVRFMSRRDLLGRKLKFAFPERPNPVFVRVLWMIRNDAGVYEHGGKILE